MKRISVRKRLVIPKTKLSGLKICPKGPDLTESIVPGSRSTMTALGTYFPPVESHIRHYHYLASWQFKWGSISTLLSDVLLYRQWHSHSPFRISLDP